MTAQSITNTAAFSLLGGHGTIDNDNGLIDDLGGLHLDAACSNHFGTDPDWVRVAYVEFTADAHGSVDFQSARTGSGYCTAICGTAGCTDTERIYYGALGLQTGTESGDLILDVPSAPQIVQEGLGQVTVDLKVANLSTAINGVQALFHYNTQNLTLLSIDPVAPWPMEFSDYTDTDGDVSYFVGMPGESTSIDGTVATLTFSAINDGTPVISFLPDHPDAYPAMCTMLTEATYGQYISPSTTDSVDGDIRILNYDECYIGGEKYDYEDPNPENECEFCDPNESLTAWTPAVDGTACGDTPGDCENQDTCNGAGTCVDNGFKDSSTECRASAGDCDVAEFCTGSDAACPADGFVSSGTECRASAGDCDIAEVCPGDSAACPADVKSTAECRAAVGECDVAEVCDGVSDDCPTDAFAPVDTPCGDTNDDACDNPDTCDGAGVCQANWEDDGTCLCGR